jgi:surfeit locus 1 family protein
MIGRLREAGLFWAGAFTVVTFCVLIGLGNWQWQRMQWKQGLLNRFAENSRLPPVTLSAIPIAANLAPSANPKDAKLAAFRYRRIEVHGTFEHTSEMLVWAPASGGPAWSVVTPLRLSAGESQNKCSNTKACPSHVLVIRGAVPDKNKPATKRGAGQMPGKQRIVGRIRLDAPNPWANDPNIAGNQWFTRDLKKMTALLRKSMQADIAIAPFFVEAGQQIGGPTAPRPDLHGPSLSNRHLSYALTWWGLAATLIGVFAAFAWSRLKAPRR